MFVASHSTTLPTAPVDAWFNSSSTENVPETLDKLIAFVALNVVAEAAEPPDYGSLTKVIFLKSFATEKSFELPLSVPSRDVFIIT